MTGMGFSRTVIDLENNSKTKNVALVLVSTSWPLSLVVSVLCAVSSRYLYHRFTLLCYLWLCSIKYLNLRFLFDADRLIDSSSLHSVTWWS